jgi:glycerol-3-phosphate cytidylyltransferase-like family protein
MTLACKHVDDVVIGAPFIITKDLITSLNIKKVIHITDTAEDTVLPQYQQSDPM